MGSLTLEKTKDVQLFSHSNPANKRTRVMVVEDDSCILELLTHVLTTQGYEVVAYNNALKALDNLSTDKVDIILSDLLMPEMDGIKFCSRVKKLFPNIFFIILTAKNTTSDKVIGLNMGADEYLTKPFDYTELVARIKAAERIVNNQKKLTYLNEKLEKIADTDPLTRLKNRRFLMNEGEKELKRAARYSHTSSLLLIDLDNLKTINDTYGHSAGDETLKAISKILSDSIRNSDILCRFAGDEFVILLPETNPKNAFKVAEKIRKSVEKTPITLENNTKIYTTLTIGIAIKTPESNLTLKKLLDQADKALYAAKKDGRNKTVLNKWFSINIINKISKNDASKQPV